VSTGGGRGAGLELWVGGGGDGCAGDAARGGEEEKNLRSGCSKSAAGVHREHTEPAAGAGAGAAGPGGDRPVGTAGA
jgi:hypothetical protein